MTDVKAESEDHAADQRHPSTFSPATVVLPIVLAIFGVAFSAAPAAAQRARDLGQGQLGGILHRTISRRCAARKLAGSVSSDSSIFARAKRATVGATARAMRSASIGASGTRAAVAMALT